jgi:protoporphyrinogen oxidase
MNEEIKDITIIGAGPVGMVTAFWAGMREASAQIVESLPELGGQLTTLYPEKWIFDIPDGDRAFVLDVSAVVPEPSVAAVVCVCGAAALLRRRRLS